MIYSNQKVKRLLKSELVKRGIKTAELVELLNQEGYNETIAGVNSKISRGTFSAAFFLECLSVIGCNRLEIEPQYSKINMAAEPIAMYKSNSDEG